jgi:hypothetical protein
MRCSKPTGPVEIRVSTTRALHLAQRRRIGLGAGSFKSSDDRALMPLRPWHQRAASTPSRFFRPNGPVWRNLLAGISRPRSTPARCRGLRRNRRVACSFSALSSLALAPICSIELPVPIGLRRCLIPKSAMADEFAPVVQIMARYRDSQTNRARKIAWPKTSANIFTWYSFSFRSVSSAAT